MEKTRPSREKPREILMLRDTLERYNACEIDNNNDLRKMRCNDKETIKTLQIAYQRLGRRYTEMKKRLEELEAKILQ